MMQGGTFHPWRNKTPQHQSPSDCSNILSQNSAASDRPKFPQCGSSEQVLHYQIHLTVITFCFFQLLRTHFLCRPWVDIRLEPHRAQTHLLAIFHFAEVYHVFKTGWFDFCEGVALMNHPASSLPVQSVTFTLLTSHFQFDLARLEPHFKIVPGTTTQWNRLTQWKAPSRDCSGLPTGQASISMNRNQFGLTDRVESSRTEQPKTIQSIPREQPKLFLNWRGVRHIFLGTSHSSHLCSLQHSTNARSLQMGRGWKGTWTSCVMAPDSVLRGGDRDVIYKTQSSFSSSAMSLYY